MLLLDYFQIILACNIIGATHRTGHAYPYRAVNVTPGFCGSSCCKYFSFSDDVVFSFIFMCNLFCSVHYIVYISSLLLVFLLMTCIGILTYLSSPKSDASVFLVFFACQIFSYIVHICINIQLTKEHKCKTNKQSKLQ